MSATLVQTEKEGGSYTCLDAAGLFLTWHLTAWITHEYPKSMTWLDNLSVYRVWWYTQSFLPTDPHAASTSRSPSKLRWMGESYGYYRDQLYPIAGCICLNGSMILWWSLRRTSAGTSSLQVAHWTRLVKGKFTDKESHWTHTYVRVHNSAYSYTDTHRYTRMHSVGQ